MAAWVSTRSARRRSLTLSATDVAQLALGLITPPLLIAHAIALYSSIRVSPNFADNYGQILAVYWSFAPFYAFLQLFVVIVVWMHGAIGVYSWLVLKPVWRRIGGLVLPVLFAVPILALLGFASAGQEVLDRLAGDPAWKQMILDNVGRIAKVTRELGELQSRAILFYGLLVLGAFAILAVRILRNRLRPVAVAYDGGTSAQGRFGLSILEISLLNDVPHAHVCSGRGRCGTCRVRIDAGARVAVAGRRPGTRHPGAGRRGRGRTPRLPGARRRSRASRSRACCRPSPTPPPRRRRRNGRPIVQRRQRRPSNERGEHGGLVGRPARQRQGEDRGARPRPGERPGGRPARAGILALCADERRRACGPRRTS